MKLCGLGLHDMDLPGGRDSARACSECRKVRKAQAREAAREIRETEPLRERPGEWVQWASCASVDPELFYSDDCGQYKNLPAARFVCGRCPVRRDCLEYAIRNHEEHGIWGGVTMGQIRGRRVREAVLAS